MHGRPGLLVAIGVPKLKGKGAPMPKDDYSEEGGGGSGDEEAMQMDAFISAVHAKDTMAAKEAMKGFLEACGAYHGEPEGDEG